MAKTAKILVLGGTGIIGRELTTVLTGMDHDVYIVSRRGGASDLKNLHYIKSDARDVEDLREKLNGFSFDAVVDLLSFDSNQMQETLEVIKNKCTQYIFISSATVYEGVIDGRPLTENTTHLTAGWNYPLQKSNAESVLRQVSDKYGINYTIVRPYITYSRQRISFGEWEGFNIVEAIRNEQPIILGDEPANSLTTLTHSYDLAVGIAGLVMNNEAMNEDFHITSDESMTWQEVFELTAKILGKQVNIVSLPVAEIKHNFPDLEGKIEDRCMGRVFDNSKLKKAIPGFKCKYSVEEGYNEIISSWLSSSTGTPKGTLQQGRINRLIAEYGLPNDIKKIKQYRKSLKKQGALPYIKYLIGYNNILYSLARIAISTRRKLKNIKSEYA